MPFDPGRDAAVYLAEVASVHLFVTTGVALFFFGIDPASFIVLGLGLVSWLYLRRRSTRLPVVDSWPRPGMNERAREMDVLRLRYACAALKELGLPTGIAYSALVLSVGVVAVALFVNRDGYF